jgi:hypothetical protein
MLSFVTCIKLCAGYETYVDRLRLYVECIVAGCAYEYEIVVVLEVGANAALEEEFGRASFLRHVVLLKYVPTYPNPHGYNMIEAFAKNVGIKAARFPFVCVTNCDILFSDSFFDLRFKPTTFYRFLTYETVPVSDWSLTLADAKMLFAEATPVNPELTLAKTLNNVGHKSGDIMLMDKDTWMKVGGFPENEVWVYSDLVVCTVVSNNGVPLEVPDASIYTYPQTHQTGQVFEHVRSLDYLRRKTTNNTFPP